ncbi:MAG TPA: MFS transporter, partial [Paracoccaceae bacterium]
AVQAAAPAVLRAASKPVSALTRAAVQWVALLLAIPLGLAGVTLLAEAPAPWLTLTLVAGLLAFGFVFAVNSALHSYLILAFSTAERVTMDVGFYYMANAAGRLIGTLLSGVSYQTGGLPACLATAGAMAALSWAAVQRIPHAQPSNLAKAR